MKFREYTIDPYWRDTRFHQMVKRNVELKWERFVGFFGGVYHAIKVEYGIVEFCDDRTIVERLKGRIWTFFTGAPYFYYGASEMRIFLHDTERKGFLGFYNVSHIDYDEDGGIWFNYLSPPVPEGKPDNIYTWPLRDFANESPMQFRKRCLEIPGMEEHRVNFYSYESIEYVGYYSYKANDKISFEMLHGPKEVVPDTPSNDKVKPFKLRERGPFSKDKPGLDEPNV
jgi:hypothetical protein